MNTSQQGSDYKSLAEDECREKSAEETQPDRQLFRLTRDAWEAWQQALDATPESMPRLRRLLNEKSVFERGEAE